MMGSDIQGELSAYSDSTEIEDNRAYPAGHPLNGAEEGLIALIGAIFTYATDRNREEPIQWDVRDAVD